MESYYIASNLVSLPSFVIAIALMGLLVHIRRPLIGITIVGISIALLIALSLPLTAHGLMQGLETSPALELPLADNAKTRLPSAIVVLGAGRYADAPEYGGDTVSRHALERLRYAAYLQRETGLPLLVTAGSPYGERVPEAALMQAVLVNDFRVPVRWVEPQARTTLEHATYVRALLQPAGIKHIVLVTHAAHMRRAVQVFADTGFKITEAPLGFSRLDKQDYGILGYLPSPHALRKSSMALHEYIGYWYYRFRLQRAPVAAADTEVHTPLKTSSALARRGAA